MDTGYEIVRKDSEGKVLIHFSGFTKPEMIQKFDNDYKNLISSINTSDTSLILDGKKLAAFPAEVEDNLIQLYKSYTVFKKIYVIPSDTVISKMQIKRVLKKAGIEDKFEFINDINDVK